jgi:RNA polymerase sigma factor (sigma-70 family)
VRLVAESSDDDLVVAAVNGDQAAFGQLVLRYQDSARRLAAGLVGASDADDVAQDAFIRAYRSLASFRVGSPFQPWLLRIVVNQAANQHRSAGRRLTRMLRAFRATERLREEREPLDFALVADDTHRLRSALDRLPRQDRNVLVVRYLMELSEEEAAVVLHCAKGTVKSRTSRALTRLRLQLPAGEQTQEEGNES